MSEMRTIPAMRPVTNTEVATAKEMGPPRVSRYQHWAIVYAIAMFDLDGQRRRVFRDGDTWRIERAFDSNTRSKPQERRTATNSTIRVSQGGSEGSGPENGTGGRE